MVREEQIEPNSSSGDQLAIQRKIVLDGYDAIALAYSAYRDRFKSRWAIELLGSLLPNGARVLDVGCGAGVPIAASLLAREFHVVGIDLSASMLSLARERVPSADLVQMDMTALGLAARSFDGLIAAYSVFHVPREQHAQVFSSFHRMLRPRGVAILSLATGPWEEVADFHGVPMFWSHHGPAESQQLLEQAAFEVRESRTIEDGGERHHWFLAARR